MTPKKRGGRVRRHLTILWDDGVTLSPYKLTKDSIRTAVLPLDKASYEAMVDKAALALQSAINRSPAHSPEPEQYPIARLVLASLLGKAGK